MPPLPCYEMTLEDKANPINSFLQKESIVALVGMGGIGKITLSKCIICSTTNMKNLTSWRMCNQKTSMM
jgi:ABC-type cobalamin/Fe3+-siderophores transport system ATPase subunit